jgi:hypothetical protein
MKTSLGEKNEKLIVAELEPIIKKFARKTGQSSEEVRSSVAYLWKDEREEAARSWDDYLSANEIGPYGGR